MGQLVQFVTSLHQATSRAYVDRMVDDKVHCMLKAKEYEVDYWDGDRRYGYGGYNYTMTNSFISGAQFINSTTVRFQSGRTYLQSANADCVAFWTVVEYV